jgi:hypothetical protein
LKHLGLEPSINKHSKNHLKIINVMSKNLITLIFIVPIFLWAWADAHEVSSPSRDKLIQYDFVVKIVSGSMAGKEFRGSFAYSLSTATQKGEESIPVADFKFTYRDGDYTHQTLDGVPQVSLKNGKFQTLVLVGGTAENRFGFNAGFEREQFNRQGVEDFVREGKPFFGYLNPDTYVDGVGKVIFTKK